MTNHHFMRSIVYSSSTDPKSLLRIHFLLQFASPKQKICILKKALDPRVSGRIGINACQKAKQTTKNAWFQDQKFHFRCVQTCSDTKMDLGFLEIGPNHPNQSISNPLEINPCLSNSPACFPEAGRGLKRFGASQKTPRCEWSMLKDDQRNMLVWLLC